MQGLRTHFVVLLAIIAAISGALHGTISPLQALEAIGIAVGMSGNRLIVLARDLVARATTAQDFSLELGFGKWATWLGVGGAIIAAVLAWYSGDQSLSATISAVLTALGINFIGLGIANGPTETTP